MGGKDAGSRKARLHVLPADIFVETARGTTILQALDDAGLKIETLCGGRGICGRCQVVVPGLHTPPKRFERDTFTPEQLAAGHRLACLWKVTGDLDVEIVPLEDFAHKAFESLGSWPPVEVLPTVRRWTVALRPPSLDDQRSDSRRLRDAVDDDGSLSLDYAVARRLSKVLRDSRWRVTVTAVGDRIVEVEPHHLRPPVGVAVDIGTTSVVAMLVNLRTGLAADVGAHSSSQARFGAEVMTRIEAASSLEGLEALQAAVVGDINRLIDESCERTGVRNDDICSVTVVGNTTMIHLFLGLPPDHIATAPFTSVVEEGVTLDAGRLGLHTHPRADVYVLPTVAGYVGADTVGAILATRMDQTTSTQVVMDIGTNGEVALAHKGELYTASAPAGPAFEGGQIRQGMRAATGAIDTVRVLDDGDLTFTTIGSVPPRGICGSALVDLCAELYRVGVVDPGGRLLDETDVEARGGTAAALRVARRVRTVDGRREIVVADADETAIGRPIALTQADVRQYQLVKSAIASAAATLLADVGLEADAVDDVFLAGTFGSHLDVRSARLTGLVPDVAPDKVHDVGNAALEGARMALLDARYRRAAEAVAARARHVELSARADMAARLLDNLAFGPGRTRQG